MRGQLRGGKRVYLFVGEEGRLKDRALAELKYSVLGKAAGELGYDLFYGTDASAIDIIACASTAPFLGGRRFIVVKRAERLSEPDKKLLAGYASNPRETTCLVLETTDESALGNFPQNIHVETARFAKVQDSRLAAWITSELRSMGKSPDARAVELLKEVFETDQALLSGELEKLASFVGERREIRLEDVEAIIGKGFVSTTFELTDAIASRDYKGALEMLQGLLEAGRSRHSDASGSIIGAISWHLKTLMRAREVFEKKGGSESAVRASLKIPKRIHDDFIAQVKKYSVEDISERLGILLGADLAIKEGRLDSKTALETAVVKLCLG